MLTKKLRKYWKRAASDYDPMLDKKSLAFTLGLNLLLMINVTIRLLPRELMLMTT